MNRKIILWNRYVAIIVLILFSLRGFAQTQDSAKEVSLPEVIIRSFEQNRKLKDVPAPVSLIGKQMLENFEEVYVNDREWRYLSEPYFSNYQNQRRSYRKRFAAIIQQGIEQGQINKIDASTAVLIILHAIGGIESWHRSTHKISGEELEENMVTILIDGLKK